MQFPSKLPIKQLNRAHPDHQLYCSAYDKIGWLHAGGEVLRQHASQFMIQRAKEPGDVYALRLRRFWNQGFLDAAIGWYTAKLFRRDPEIDTPEGQDWQSWLDNCDGKDSEYAAFFEQIFTSAALYKTAYVLVDFPKVEQQPADRAEESDMGLDRPYLVAYTPKDVINWGNDDLGALEWCVIRAECFKSPTPDMDEGVKEVTWAVYDREQFAVYQWGGAATKYNGADGEADLVTPASPHFLAKNGKRQIPVKRIEVDDSLWLGNRALLQLEQFLEQLNAYSWSLHMSNFPIPVIIGPFEEKTLTLSEFAYLHLPDPASSVQWLEPGGASHQHAADFLHNLREELYRVCYLQAQGRSSTATAAASSGYSKELDMAPAVEVLNKFGDMVRGAQEDVLELVAIARGLPDAEISVRGYSFDPSTVYGEIAVGQALKDYGINSPTLERTVDQKIAKCALEDVPKKIQDLVAAEIDANPTASEKAAKMEKATIAEMTGSFTNLSQRTIGARELGAVS